MLRRIPNAPASLTALRSCSGIAAPLIIVPLISEQPAAGGQHVQKIFIADRKHFAANNAFTDAMVHDVWAVHQRTVEIPIGQ